MMKKGILVALFVWAAIPASASTWRGDALLRQVQLAPWKFGPFRIQPQVVLSDFGYDSNIYHQPDAVEDYSLTVGPQVNAYLALKKKIIFTLSESPRYVHYFETARERTWNNFLNAQAAFLFNRFFIQVGGHANDARQRWNYEIDIRPRLKDTGYDTLFLWQPTRKTALSFGFRQTRFRYENIAFESLNIAERLNRDETAFNLTLQKRLGSRTLAFLDFEYVHADFERVDNPRDALSYAGYAGFEFSTWARVRGRIRLGYKLFHPLTAGLSDYKGLVGDSSFSVVLMRPLVLRASYRRDIRFSLWSQYTYFIDNTSGLGMSCYVLRRRFRLDYDYSQIQYDYAADSNSVPSRRDRLYMNSAGIFLRIGGNVGIGVRAGRYNRRINIYGWKVNRNFIGLNLTYEF